MDIALEFEKRFQEVAPMEFYRDIFPEGSFEEKGVYEGGKYNGVLVEVTSEWVNKKQKIIRKTITDDLDAIQESIKGDNFCLMSPISYCGKSRKSDNARFMYALAIDLDGVVTKKNLDVLFCQIERGDEMLGFVWGLPKPTYLVASGTGIHLYYVFEKPIPLFKNIVKELEKLKKRLTWQAWTQGASTLTENIQYESLFQGFRVVGSITKKGTRTRAFYFNDKVTVEELNNYVPEEYRANDFTYKSDLTLKAAAKKYPEWYEKRIVQKQPRGTWVCKKDLYDWWIRKVLGGATQGHRYWCLMTLATYAKKCGVDYDTLCKDAIDLLPFLNSVGDEFTADDAMHALEAYTDSYITYPIDTIVDRTDISIQKNKRNYRKQNQHLKIARFARDLNYPDENGWINKNGAPTKQDVVLEWRKIHPEGRKADCIRDTGLSKPTVLKWWSGEVKKKEKTTAKKEVEIGEILDELKAQKIIHEELMQKFLYMNLDNTTENEALDLLRKIQDTEKRLHVMDEDCSWSFEKRL